MSIKIKRHENNPLITPKDVKPTFDNFKVECTMNAGVTEYNDEVIMLLRVAESVKSFDKLVINIPLLEKDKEGNYTLVTKSVHKVNDCDKYDFSDSRIIYANDKFKTVIYLTSISSFRIARSKDGVNFTVDEKPFIFPEGQYETWGIEDPRITKIDDFYYINYTAVSEIGAASALIKTNDFKTYERLGIIFPPENKDVSIFPEKINGVYYAYHRPVPKAIGNPDIWIATSSDLIHWGNNHHVLSISNNDSWEDGRIGGGAPSFKTDKGWIHIYHAADKNHRYCLGAFLTDMNDPTKIIAKTKEPILQPETDYEKFGFFGNVVFTCGVIYKNDIVKIYYGAADEVMALAEINIFDIYEALGVK